MCIPLCPLCSVIVNCSSMYPKPMCSGLHPLLSPSFGYPLLSCTIYPFSTAPFPSWTNRPIQTIEQSPLTSYSFLATTPFLCFHSHTLEKLPVHMISEPPLLFHFSNCSIHHSTESTLVKPPSRGKIQWVLVLPHVS